MKLLNELLSLRESAEKNLLGLIINGKEITKDTLFNKWRGNFSCYSNKLTSLEYCPSEVGGDFLCFNNVLTSLEYCPSEVGGDFSCYNNKLTSLEYCPSEVVGNFYCSSNKLTSLEYCPSEVGGDFSCSDNKLTSLEYCPSEVGGSFYCSDNKLTSLEYCPSEVGGNFYCSYNELISLKDIHKQLTKMKGKFVAPQNPIKSHVIGILLVEGCTGLLIDNKKVEAIINKYLPNKEGKAGFMKCKHELQDADFDEYAKL
jgi:hypothetical protein